MRPWPFSTVSARATSGGGSSQGGSVAEGDGDVAMQLRLVRLHDEQVVALSVTHMAADLALGEDRIAGDDRTLQGQSLEQRQRRRNLVRLGRHDEVADHRRVSKRPFKRTVRKSSRTSRNSLRCSRWSKSTKRSDECAQWRHPRE